MADLNFALNCQTVVFAKIELSHKIQTHNLVNNNNNNNNNNDRLTAFDPGQPG